MSTDTAPRAADIVWPEGYDRVSLDVTDSTMSEARRRAPALRRPTWIMARRQTAPHGRRGRAWINPEGNLAATLVIRPGGEARRAALRSFIAALALHRTLAQHIDRQRLMLKWPNDVLLDGGKVAGILLETTGQGGRPDWLAIGIGVNLLTAPGTAEVEPGAVAPVSLAGQGGAAVAPEAFLSGLAQHFAALEQSFQDAGFDPIRALWLRDAARLGQVITARLPREEITGTFVTIDSDGQLILRSATGPRVIAAADVYF